MSTSDFDYGCEFAPEVDNFKLWPREGSFTALLDGDMLPYIAGYTTDIQDANRALRNTCLVIPAPFNNTCPSYQTWFEELLKQPEFWNKCNQINWLINDWVKKAGADSALIYLTKSDTNYRNALAFTKPYKGQRKSEKPPFFHELRHYIAIHHEAIIADGMEADDLMSIEQNERHRKLCSDKIEIGSAMHKAFSDSAIVSKDKDLKIVPGWNVDPDTGDKTWHTVLGHIEAKWKDKEVTSYEVWPTVSGVATDPAIIIASGLKADTYASGVNKGQLKTKRVATGVQSSQYIDKLRGSGLKFFYSQLLTGDQVDNYPGIPGLGATKAFELLETLNTEEELFTVVRDAYKAHYAGGTSEAVAVNNYRGGTTKLTAMQLMIEQGRLAHMQTFHGEIWRAKNYLPSGEDQVWQQGLKTNTCQL
jgi:hypothetical protein